MMDFGVKKNGRNLTASCFAPGAEKVRLKLFKKGGKEPAQSIDMIPAECNKAVFTCNFASDADEYLFENNGTCFIDPFAKQIAGNGRYGQECENDGESGKVDEAGSLRGVIVRSGIKKRPEDGRFRSVDFSDMVLYKLHIRGFTAHETSGVKHKGTFTGVVEKIPYLKDLGINAVLLMPCYDFDEAMDCGFAAPKKLNFWGYGAPSHYFAPKTSYASKPDRVREEFFEMVREFHKAGIAVLMEMDFGPGTSDAYMLEVLRYWKCEYEIDGFRLIGEYALKRLFATDPYLSDIKLIGNTWDDDSIRAVSSETARLADCNDGFMISVRRFIKGDEGQIRDFAEHLRQGCVKSARINYLADHDGFTLNDVFSYDERHNEANGEMNLDGREINYSWNCGIEGPTGKRNVQKLRLRMIKNALSILFLSQGTPMLLAGDEFGNTHQGNNNPYCCDNEQSWVVWDKTARAREIRSFTRSLIQLRRKHRVFSNKIELTGTDYIYNGCPDVSFHGTKAWFPDYGYYSRTIGVLLNGEYAVVDRDKRDKTYYIAFNMHWEEHEFDLPGSNKADFVRVITTDPDNKVSDNRTCIIRPRSIAVFELCQK